MEGRESKTLMNERGEVENKSKKKEATRTVKGKGRRVSHVIGQIVERCAKVNQDWSITEKE